VSELLNTLGNLSRDLGTLLVQVLQLLANWALLLVWVAWWLWGVNWKKAWPVLAQGAWAPAVLAWVLVAMVWSQITPRDCSCLGIVTLPNFWWQLGEVGMYFATALFCGWLQGIFHWTPAEMSLEPPQAAHGHGHELGHNHH